MYDFERDNPTLLGEKAEAICALPENLIGYSEYKQLIWYSAAISTTNKMWIATKNNEIYVCSIVPDNWIWSPKSPDTYSVVTDSIATHLVDCNDDFISLERSFLVAFLFLNSISELKLCNDRHLDIVLISMNPFIWKQSSKGDYCPFKTSEINEWVLVSDYVKALKSLNNNATIVCGNTFSYDDCYQMVMNFLLYHIEKFEFDLMPLVNLLEKNESLVLNYKEAINSPLSNIWNESYIKSKDFNLQKFDYKI